AALLLGGCAVPLPAPPPTQPPIQWSAPRPHAGSPAELQRWWQQFDDPLLAELVSAAQQQNPSLAQAAARIAEARANAAMAGAAAWPKLEARGSAVRSSTQLPPMTGTRTQIGAELDASWEIDLFGSARLGAAAAQARADGSALQWHEARVSLAAEVASTYAGLRGCEALSDIYEQDLSSRTQTAELTRQKIDAGFEAPANGALARAGAAEAAGRLAAQRAECQVLIKQLVALTARDEAALVAELAPRRAQLPQPAAFDVAAVPAAVLSQRPDLAAAERAVAAASADVGVAQADRYPRISLSASIGRAGVWFAGQQLDARSWSIGPGLVLPLFDAGRRAAAVDAARARFDSAVAAWRDRTLQAVREVEQALVRLDAADRREQEARQAAQGYAEFLAAAQMQWQVGTGSLLDLEQARRNALASNATVLQTRSDRLTAWLALYKAVGGGWRPGDAAPPDPLPSN
ncbi:MAG: efflux transporter outer membrane subunit, partial [Burkholderiaceae bacterium]